MVTDTSAVRTYFGKLGLEPEIADIYLALYSHGPQTISELSRTSKVERTRIYRLLDKLMDSNLIEVESHYKRGIIKAAPIANLNILISEKEQELKSLQDELELIQRVLTRNSLSNPATRVQFYSGKEGVRQMLWNELRAKGELVGYANRILEEATGKKFMERWTDEFEARGLKARILLNDEFVKSWIMGRDTVGTDRRVENMAYHHLPDSLFKITHLSDVYDDVVVYYQWKDNDVFGLEIYNKNIADAQRAFFEMLWAKSKPETRF